MVRRHEVTDALWQRIESLLPGNGGPGGQREWAVNINSTSCQAHQHPAGAPRQHPADHPQKRAVP